MNLTPSDQLSQHAPEPDTSPESLTDVWRSIDTGPTSTTSRIPRVLVGVGAGVAAATALALALPTVIAPASDPTAPEGVSIQLLAETAAKGDDQTIPEGKYLHVTYHQYQPAGLLSPGAPEESASFEEWYAPDGSVWGHDARAWDTTSDQEDWWYYPLVDGARVAPETLAGVTDPAAWMQELRKEYEADQPSEEYLKVLESEDPDAEPPTPDEVMENTLFRSLISGFGPAPVNAAIITALGDYGYTTSQRTTVDGDSCLSLDKVRGDQVEYACFDPESFVLLQTGDGSGFYKNASDREFVDQLPADAIAVQRQEG